MRSILLSCALLMCFHSFGQRHPQWGNLSSGPFAVGYQVIRTHDLSRTYMGLDGKKYPRPIQLYVWYPTNKPGASMAYRDYLADIGYDLGSIINPDELRDYVVREFRDAPLTQAFQKNITDDEFERMLSTPTAASRNAPIAAGEFPLLVHMHVSGNLSNSIQPEYFASHGFIFASISWIGTGPAFYGRGQQGLAATMEQLEDVAFAVGEMKKWPATKNQSIAFTGMFAQVAWQLQMKEQLFDAIACTDCITLPHVISKIPHYNVERVRIPVFDLHSQQGNGHSIIDSLIYADRWRFVVEGLTHADLYPFQQVARPEKAGQYRKSEIASQWLLTFFQAFLRADAKARAQLASSVGLTPTDVKVVHDPAQADAPPDHEEFLAWVRYGNMTKALAAYKKFGKALIDKDAFQNVLMFLGRDRAPHSWEATRLFVEAFPSEPRMLMTLNNHGYGFLEQKNFALAKEAFLLMKNQFPSSPYAHDGWSDYCVAVGDQELAQDAAREALALCLNSSLPPQEKSGLRSSIEAKIGKNTTWPVQPLATAAAPLNEVGFKVVDTFTRDGLALKIGIWFPALAGKTKMTRSDLLMTTKSSEGSVGNDFKRMAERIAGENLDSVQFQNYLQEGIPLWKDGKAKKGKFPLVLVSGNLFDYYALVQSIASQGYVVACVTTKINEPFWPADNALHYSAFTNALEDGLNYLLKQSYVDANNISVFGHGGGIQAAAYLAMRRSEIKRVVNLDGGFFGPRSKSTRSADYQPASLTAPFLHLVTAGQAAEDDAVQLAALRSPLFRVRWSSHAVHHHDFTVYGQVVAYCRRLNATHPAMQANQIATNLILQFLSEDRVKPEQATLYQTEVVH